MRRSHPFITVTLCLALILVVALQAAAIDPVNTTFFGNLAIKGYDAVAYFTEGKAVKGKKEHSFEWQDAVWRFASREHLEQFQADPEKYAPQYGGYCAWAVSQGETADIDPEAWKIVDGKLYMNYNQKIQKQWEEDIPGFIASADEQWPKLLSK
jgi:YHS domain-containing protein